MLQWYVKVEFLQVFRFFEVDVGQWTGLVDHTTIGYFCNFLRNTLLKGQLFGSCKFGRYVYSLICQETDIMWYPKKNCNFVSLRDNDIPVEIERIANSSYGRQTIYGDQLCELTLQPDE